MIAKVIFYCNLSSFTHYPFPPLQGQKTTKERKQELTDLMGQLMTQDGHGCADASCHSVSKRSSYRQTVAKVVNPVAKNDHPRHGRHGARDCVTVGVSVPMSMTVTVSVRVAEGRDCFIHVRVQWRVRLTLSFVTLVEQHFMRGISVAFQSCWNKMTKCE